MDDAAIDNVTLAKHSCQHLYTPISQRQLSHYEPFFDSLADDVVLESASPEGNDVTYGKHAVVDQVRTSYLKLVQPEQETDVELERPLEYLTNGDRVVALWRECSRDKNSGAVTFSREVAVVMDFRDGLICRLRRFSQ